MLRNRGSRFDTGWLVTFSFFFILVEKNLLRNFLSVAKMASLVYERENCLAAEATKGSLSNNDNNAYDNVDQKATLYSTYESRENSDSFTFFRICRRWLFHVVVL